MKAFVREYQRFGFFAGESSSAAADRIERAYRREWEEEPTIEAAPQGDFLDLCVLPAINALIDGRRFELYRPDAALGQMAFVVALTAKQKRALEEHGWTFATPANIRNTFGYGQLYETGEPAACGT